ncbi:MAG: DUF2384 domain-containing protein [Bacteroidetes bacterium]|jgi:putative toxin-antitoxin system antitoxin component (TIGR02293 family)|nr:DUF2384 domain-containing protein [Bacteroidota bacterium]
MQAEERTSQHAFDAKMRRVLEVKKRASVAQASEVREGLPYEHLDMMAETLGLDPAALSHVLKVSPRTLQRRRKEGQLRPAESDRLWRLMHIYDQALDAFDRREEEARLWLTTPKRTLQGETPVEHLDTEPGLRLVEQMLATIAHTMPA